MSDKLKYPQINRPTPWTEMVDRSEYDRLLEENQNLKKAFEALKAEYENLQDSIQYGGT